MPRGHLVHIAFQALAVLQQVQPSSHDQEGIDLLVELLVSEDHSSRGLFLQKIYHFSVGILSISLGSVASHGQRANRDAAQHGQQYS